MMLGYYSTLALRSLARNRLLTALMVLAVALGIGAAMTVLTVYRVLAADPLPERSGVLFHPRLDPRPVNAQATAVEEPPSLLTRYDAEELLRQARGVRQSVNGAGSLIARTDTSTAPTRLVARYASADFFPMFAVPFLKGHAWSRQDDVDRARVAVLSARMAGRLFPGQEAMGQTLRLDGQVFQVVGVIGPWLSRPRFYDMEGSQFGGQDDVYLPFSTARALHLARMGSTSCYADPFASGQAPDDLGAPCTWVNYWVQLDSPAQADAYRRYLRDYAAAQHQAGRFARPPTSVRLDSLMDWLALRHAVPDDVRLQLWLAGGFLAVCLLNTVVLLLAKFLRRRGEFGVRRALGASRRAIFAQCLVEAAAIGTAGAVLGIGLTLAGLWLVRQQPDDYAALARLDLPMLALTVGASVLASVLAGLLPAWRACQVAPALQLKSQ